MKGTEYFSDGFGIQPNFWRAPSDNDYGNGAPTRLQVWKQSSKNFQVTDADISEEGNAAVIKATYLLAAGNLYIIQYKIFPDGIVKVNAAFTSTSMEETPTEVSEATRTATFSPEVKSRPGKNLKTGSTPYRSPLPFTPYAEPNSIFRTRTGRKLRGQECRNFRRTL